MLSTGSWRMLVSVVWVGGILGRGPSLARPWAEAPAAGPKAPATAAEAIRTIDLRSLARLSAKRVLEDSATYLYYSAETSVAGRWPTTKANCRRAVGRWCPTMSRTILSIATCSSRKTVITCG